MAGTYLVSLPLGPGMGPRVNKVDSILVYAGSSTDAITIAKNEFNFNVDALWAAATVTLMAAGADMTGWNARVKVASTAGVVKADVTVNSASKTAVAAVGTLTLTGPPTAGDSIVINGVTYTWQSTIGTAGDVHFTDAATACSNLILAVNAGANSGNYIATTVSPNADLVASAGAGTTVKFTAKTAGVSGNLLTLTLSITGGAGSVDGSGKIGGTTAGKYGPTVDGLGQALVDALNGSPQGLIAGAAYVVSTHTLTVAETTDALGDHAVFTYFYPPNGSRDSVVSFVGAVTNLGSGSAALKQVLTAANTIPSAIIPAQVNPFY